MAEPPTKARSMSRYYPHSPALRRGRPAPVGAPSHVGCLIGSPVVVLEALGDAVAFRNGRLEALAVRAADQPVPGPRGRGVALARLQLRLDQPPPRIFPEHLGAAGVQHPGFELAGRRRAGQMALEREPRAGSDVEQLHHVRQVVGDQVQLPAPGLVDPAHVLAVAGRRAHGRGAAVAFEYAGSRPRSQTCLRAPSSSRSPPLPGRVGTPTSPRSMTGGWSTSSSFQGTSSMSISMMRTLGTHAQRWAECIVERWL